MSSIRLQFVLGSALGVALVMIVAALATHWSVDRSLQAQLDDSLLQELAVFTERVEIDDEGLGFDSEDHDWGDFEDDPPDAFLQVLDADGGVLFRSPGLEAGLVEPFGALEDPELRWITLGERRARAAGISVYPRIDHDEDERPGLQDGDKLHPVHVLLARQDRFRGPFLQRFRLMSVLVLLAALIATGWLMTWIGRRALHGLDDLAARIEGLAVDGTAAPIEETAVPDEARPIVARLNALLMRVRESVERERALSADIAHELRTPIAGLRAMIEVARHRERQPQEYRDTLREALEVVVQTEAMVERLLHLNRLESGQLAVVRHKLDLGSLVHSQWSLQRVRARNRQLHVDLELSEGVAVGSDPELLSLLVSNLLDNAVSHADHGGSIRVRVQDQDRRGLLTIANSGSRVPQAEIAGLFERFSRGDPARGATGSHMGLGLTIVRRAAELLEAKIAIQTQAAGEFIVRVSMPASTG